MQVCSRLLLVWLVVNPYPQETSTSPFYSTMLVAWSATEVIRYSYFVLNLRGWVPGFVTWLRYNAFYVMYPLGIGSECWLIWLASGVAPAWYGWALWAILGAYVPGEFRQFRLHSLGGEIKEDWANLRQGAIFYIRTWLRRGGRRWGGRDWRGGVGPRPSKECFKEREGLRKKRKDPRFLFGPYISWTVFDIMVSV